MIEFLLSKAADLNVFTVDFEHVLCAGFLGEINTVGKPMFKVSNKNFRLLFWELHRICPELSVKMPGQRLRTRILKKSAALSGRFV